jgi:hypothetical protein
MQHVNTHVDLEQVKTELAEKGWSNRTAAGRLRCSATHLSYILNGKRTSISLMAKIKALPVNKRPAHIGVAAFMRKRVALNAKLAAL